MIKIGYLGPEGTFCEEAARKLAGRGKRVELISCPDIPTVIQNVGCQFGCGVVPIENSNSGTIAETLDELLQAEVFITDEVVIPINHCLLIRPGTELARVKKVLSHPQALAQCKGYLRHYFPQAELVPAPSTAAAARMAAASKFPLAAIAGKRVARQLGLQVLQELVNDEEQNFTRFVGVRTEAAASTGRDRTSVVFALRGNRAGALHAALGVFARRAINLTKIESRPARRFLGEYLFYVDFLGHRQEKVVDEALAELKEMCEFYKYLGSYPVASYYRENEGEKKRNIVGGYESSSVDNTSV